MGVSFHRTTTASTTTIQKQYQCTLASQDQYIMENNSTTDHHQHGDIKLSVGVAVAVFFSSFLFFSFVYLYCLRRCNKKLLTLWSPYPLPMITYRRASDLAAGCVVCLCEFEEGEAVKQITGCGHVFHPQCIDQWLAGCRSCPVCRCSDIFGNKVVQEVMVESMESVVDSVVEVGGIDWDLTRLERSRSLSDRVSGEGESEVVLRRTLSF